MLSIELFRREENSQSFTAGQTIFNAGEVGDSMFVVIEGQVDLLVRGTLVEQLGPGGMFGEMALLDKEPRVATAIAGTDCKVVPINEKRFNFLVQQTPHFALQLMRVIADRLRRMDSRL
jgi:CRP-like cAMP-binding protein